MGITTKLNSKSNIKQSSGADLIPAVIPFSINSKILKEDKNSVVFVKMGAQTIQIKSTPQF